MSAIPVVCYEIFVRSFCDTNGDGIGDINGITSRLDYLEELGVEAIWLTPIHPSPSYHKYDVVDYYRVDPEFGTLDDFKRLLREAHARGIQVYMDLVIHHTSTQHPWFQAARSHPDSPYRRYYRWMDPVRIRERGLAVRELTQDAHVVNPWHRIKGDKERYYGIFCDYMADLFFDEPRLWDEIRSIVRFWLLEIGVDGFRLDAARHIYPVEEESRNPEFWVKFRDLVESVAPETYTVGEVWTKASRVAPYFEGLRANFDFDLCFALQSLSVNRSAEALLALLQDNYASFRAVNPLFIDATLLGNHDQQRIASTLKGHARKLKLAASLLLTLPGQPYLYYGEEIGMKGQKPDPYLREPFFWGEEDTGTARWMTPKYNSPEKSVSLSAMRADPGSLFYHYKNLIGLRKKYPALAQVQGANLEPAPVGDDEVLAFVRTHDTAPVLAIHNLSASVKILRWEGDIAAFNCFILKTSVMSEFREGVLILPGFESVLLKKQTINADGFFEL